MRRAHQRSGWNQPVTDRAKVDVHFCIIGTGRCGSTLLQRMLDRHPELFVFPETHWLPKLVEWFGHGPAPVEDQLAVLRRTRHVGGKPTTPLTDAQLRQIHDAGQQLTVQRFAEAVAHAVASPKKVGLWADKTPDYAYCMGALQALWPDCRFIHLLRDGPAVVRSMSRHPGYQALVDRSALFWCPLSFDYEPTQPAEPAPLEAFVSLWYRRMLRLQDEATRLAPGSYLEIRLEELVARPEVTLQRIREFALLPPAKGWIEDAAALVDPARVVPRQRQEVLRHFGDAERALLRELGDSGGRKP